MQRKKEIERGNAKHTEFYNFIRKDSEHLDWNQHSLLPKKSILEKESPFEFYTELVNSYRDEHYNMNCKIIAHLNIEGETSLQWFERVVNGKENTVSLQYKKNREIASKQQQNEYEERKSLASKVLPPNYLSLGISFLAENPTITTTELIEKVIGTKPETNIGKAFKRWEKRSNLIRNYNSSI